MPLCPWDFLGKNTGVGCHFLLQRVFPTQGSNLGLPHCRQTLYCLSHQGSHCREFWQNVVYWRRDWQTTSVFLPWEPHEEYEKAKRYDTERWTPQVKKCPICYWRLVEKWKNSRKNEEMEQKQKQHPVVDVTGNGSKGRCCKEQYCIGTWNVRSMNQGKLKVVKQEMANVNIDILGISKLIWTGMGEFNSADHYIYYCGQ